MSLAADAASTGAVARVLWTALFLAQPCGVPWSV